MVLRPADDEIAVPREIDEVHRVRVTRQRAHLPPTHFYLMGVPGKCWDSMSGRVSQEDLSESCLGWQKFGLAF